MDELIKTRRISLPEISSAQYPITGEANDYKAIIKDGLKGRPFIPGSSIKGAIRSMLFHYLFGKEKDFKKRDWLEQAANKRIKGFVLDKNVLGEFEGSLMRFIHCSDVYFKDLSIVNTKVFNLHKALGAWEGGWKHELRGSNNPKFQPSGFTTAYEVLPIGSVAKIRLKFNRGMFEKYNEEKPSHAKSLPPNALNLFLSKSFEEVLFELISNQTEQYLNAEKTFFEKHTIAETRAILEQLEDVKAQNEDKHPVFRIASGSGFHSVTGDWRFEDHLQTIQKPDRVNSSKRYVRGAHYKSRRLAFKADKQGDYRFYPMGFVRLVSSDYYEHHLKPQIEAQKEAEAKQQQEEAETKRLRQEEESKKAEEARKPRMRTLREVKKGGIIDAEVIGQKGKQVQVKPFIEGYEGQVLGVRYPAGFPIGTIVQIKTKVQKKQLQFVGAPRQKK